MQRSAWRSSFGPAWGKPGDLVSISDGATWRIEVVPQNGPGPSLIDAFRYAATVNRLLALSGLSSMLVATCCHVASHGAVGESAR